MVPSDEPLRAINEGKEGPERTGNHHKGSYPRVYLMNVTFGQSSRGGPPLVGVCPEYKNGRLSWGKSPSYPTCVGTSRSRYRLNGKVTVPDDFT